MRYDFLVKHNGIYYQPGEDVPDDGVSSISEKKQKKKYSKSDIARMSVADLRELAKEFGIPAASGKVLKEKIAEKLVL